MFMKKIIRYNTDFPASSIKTIADWKIDYSKVGYAEKLDDFYKLKFGDILFSNINSVKHIGKITFYNED
jgi:type I restriction enzyme, S subunit